VNVCVCACLGEVMQRRVMGRELVLCYMGGWVWKYVCVCVCVCVCVGGVVQRRVMGTKLAAVLCMCVGGCGYIYVCVCVCVFR